MSARSHHLRTLSLGLFALLTALLIGSSFLPAAQQSASAEKIVARAWSLARASGDYTFQTVVDQQVQSAPSLQSAGRPPRHDYLTLRGKIDQAAERMDLSLWRSRDPQPTNALEIRLEDGQAQGRVGAESWQPIDVDTTNFAPGGDPLGFLAGAHDVQAGAVETRALGDVSRTYAPYTFALDGHAFARYLERTLVPQLRESGKLPAWMSVDLAAQYGNLQGTGTLWLDQDGLPARLQLDIQMPASKQAGTIQAAIITDYNDFNRAQLALASTRFFDNPAGWLGYRISQWPAVAPSLSTVATQLLAILAVCALIVLSAPVWQSRRFYFGVVMLVSLSMVASPLLQANVVVAFAAEQETAAAEQAATVARIDAQQAGIDALDAPTMNPHQSPLAATDPRKSALPVAGPLASNVSAQAQTDITDTTDTDSDGLTDVEEAEWGTCVGASSSSDDCAGVADPTDSDADGISDGVEVHSLGIDPAAADSDQDSINDELEVKGFTLSGKTWYLNPAEADSNSDGLIDSVDCPLWSTVSTTYNATAACPDTDGDSSPDVWDDDNDNDGVLDAVDLSPAAKSGSYNDTKPVSLTLNSLEANKPVFVDLQLRPNDSRHLSYITSMLDWPLDDEGQFQRHLDTTFASTANPAILSADSNAGYGDVRVLPLLEITMPGTSGHYANLPVADTYQGTSRPAGLAADEWLDEDTLDPYGISIRDIDTSTGELQAYVPLTVVNDDIGGGRAAYNARMLYWPSQTTSAGTVDWGSAHEYRIIWLVQMITDACVDPTADEATCAREDSLDVIHIYRDEAWTLTGLEVREDHGLDVALLYEDPAQDSDLSQDNAIWEASWNLNNTFLRGRDCDSMSNGVCSGNDQRDVTIANMESSIDTWSANTDPIEARSFSYDHQGYLTQIMMSETADLLADVFTTHAADTDPTVLFAREETYRAMNLEALSSRASPLSFNLSSANAPETVQANMSWATYRYEDGSWGNYDADQNLDRLTLQLAEQSYFQAADSSDESADEAAGKLIWAQFYYTSMAAGLTSVVSMDDELLWTAATGDVPEVSYAPANPAGLITGAAFVGNAYLMMLVDTITSDTSRVFTSLSDAFQNTNLTRGVRESFKYGAVASNMLMTATSAAVVVGMSMYLSGALSGDETIQHIGEIVLSATTVAISIVWSVNVIATMSASGFTTVFSMAAFKAAAPTRAIGPVGLLIGVVAIWGIFAVQGLSNGLFSDLNSVAFNSALAYVVAGTIVLLIMFFIDLIPFVGTLVVLAIYVADVLMTWFCKKTCHGGAQAWLTEVIADSLYQVNDVIKNLDSPDRLAFDITDVSFASDEAGYTTRNDVTVTMQVTNTLNYGGSFSDSDANRATFRYFLQNAATDQHAALALGQMRDEWSNVAGRNIRTSDTLSSTVALSSVGTGINRDLGGELYLTESYVGLYAGCWLAFGIDTNDCDFFPYSSSSHIDIGSYIVYDILPTDLTSFVLRTWVSGDVMSTPYDADGDSLISRVHGGTDPSDSTWDGDGDGLSDEYELSNGLKTDGSDTDGDGLTDLQEERRGLDALDADADDDGMSDAQEWTGWQFGYVELDGTAHMTWVWPDPFSADADADNLNDLEEFYYGFNPLVATDSDAVLNTITFEDSVVTETNAPEALLRLEETDGAILFADSSGKDRSFTCADDQCPVGGVTGRYGSAAQFDGSNDALATDAAVTELAQGSFTLAAWVKTTGTSQALITKSDGDSSWEQGEKSFYLDSSGKLTFVGWGNNYIRSTAAVNDGAWHHVAVSWAYSSGTSGTAKIYLDAADVTDTSTTTYAANNADNADDTVSIGLSNKFAGEAPNNFSGSLDEVAIFGRALAAAEISALMSARYNADDNTVTPGDTLTYNLTINNNSATWPVKATYYGQLDESYTGYQSVAPLGEWALDETSGTSFADSSGNGYSATCTSCPTVGATGYSGNALQFDGVNDELILDTAARAWDGSGFSYGAWVYPTTASNRYSVVVAQLGTGTNTSSGDVHDALLYDSTNKYFSHTAGNTGVNSVLPNQWYHVMITIDPDSDVERIYLNGVLKGTNTYGDAPGDDWRFRIGGPSYVQSSNTFYNFAGRIDGVTMYDRRLSASDVALVMAGTTTLQEPVEQSSAVYSAPVLDSVEVSEETTIPSGQQSGAYVLSQVVEAALDVTDETNSGSASPDPDTTLQGHYDFDDPPGDSTISDSARRLGDGTCTSCPTMGIRGKVNRAALFDGSDLVSISALDQLGENYTVAAWVKARNGIIAEEMRAIKPFRLWTDRYDYRKYTGTLGNGYYGSNHVGYELPSASEWVHVAVTYNGTTSANAIYLNGTLASVPWPSCCSDDAGGSHQIKLGQLLNGYLDDVRLYSRTMTAAEVQTLYATSAPQLQLEFEEDSSATSFQDSTSNNYDATIVDAGAGLPGRIGTGAFFDGATGYAKISSAPVIGALTDSLTVMSWVKPTTTTGTQRFVASGRTSSNNGFGFGVQNGKLQFSVFGVQDYTSSASLSLDTWQHVAVVFDSAYDAKFYVDGAYIDTVAGTVAAAANSDDPLYIGASTVSGSSTITERFNGKLDELFVHNRTLGDAEIERSYYNQFRWFRKQHDSYLKIDTDAPTITLLNTEFDTWAGEWENAPIQFVVNASDTGSSIWSFEYGVANSNSLDLTWQSAPRCAGGDEALWCPTFDPSQLSGEGIYTVKFRAVDAVGNTTTSDDYYFLRVDETPPTAASSYSNTWLSLTQDVQDELAWSVNLSGTVTDPTIKWSASGYNASYPGEVDTDSVTVSLIDATGAVAGKGTQPATLGNNGWSTSPWSIDYAFVGTRPSGVYTVQVTASDIVGNTATVDVGTIVLDARPPSSESQSAALDEPILGADTVLSGVLADLPAPAGAVARFHFEEAADATTFADYSGADNDAACTTCPGRTAGLFGQALEFNKSAATVLTVPAATSLEPSVVTLSAWVKPTWTAGTNGYDPGILGMRSNTETRLSWHISDDYQAIELWNGATLGSLPAALTPGQWHHLAIVHDGAQWTGYLNGVSLGTVTQPLGSASGLPLTIGTSGANEYFTGPIDQVTLFERALTAEEIYALAQSEVSGAAAAEVGLELFNIDGSTSATSWETAPIAQSAAGLTTWSYGIPDQLENFYHVKVRGEDAEGNRSTEDTIWRGAIDTTDPRLTVSAQQRYGGELAVTEYTITADDLFLDPDSLTQPCSSDAVTLRYHDDPDRVNGVDIVCQQTGHQTAPVTVTVCDYANNCTTQTVTPLASTGEAAIRIDAPTGTVATGSAPITIRGVAYAGDGIDQITLSIDGSIVTTVSYLAGSTQTDWQVTWTPSGLGSHTIVATLTSDDASASDTQEFVIIDNTPTSTPTPTATSTPTATATASPTTIVTSTPTVSPTTIVTSTPTVSPTTTTTVSPTVTTTATASPTTTSTLTPRAYLPLVTR